jgi:hypothetical protein
MPIELVITYVSIFTVTIAVAVWLEKADSSRPKAGKN